MAIELDVSAAASIMIDLPAAHAGARMSPTLRATHTRRDFALRVGLGVTIVCFLVWHYNTRPVVAALAREGPGFFLAAVIVFVGGQMISAYRWQLLAAIVGVRGPFAEFLVWYFVGTFTNLFVPGQTGGDAVRVLYLSRRHGRIGEALASVVANRSYGLLGLFWLAALSTYLLRGFRLPAAAATPVFCVGAFTLAMYVSTPWLAGLIHLMPRPIRRAGGILAPYLHNPLRAIPAIALSIALQILNAAGQWLLALGFGLHLPLALFLVVVPITGVFSSLPITLNGLGLRETAYLALFGMAGVSHNDAIAMGLLYFAATMLTGLCGAIAFVTTGLPSRIPSLQQPQPSQELIDPCVIAAHGAKTPAIGGQ